MATKKESTGISIESAIADLAAAEAEAKSINAEAGIVRAVKSSAAVAVITAANSSGYEEKSLRSSLLSAGVPKGTASKIITVLRAVAEGKVNLSEASSLSGLYALATKSETVETVETVETAPAGPTVVEKIVEKTREFTTPEEVVDYLIATFILSQSDPFTAGGKVLRMATEKIGDATSPYAHVED